MLKVIFSIILLTSAIYAKENGSKPHNIYVTYTMGQSSVESEKVLGSEPMSNIVGGDSVRQELEIGLNYKDRGHRYQFFTYAWLNDEVKHNEKGLGIGLNYHMPELQSIPLRVLFTASSGIGYQSTEGQSITTATNVTNIGYVTGGSARTGSFQGKFTKDTYVIEMGLGIGLVYDITKSIYVSAGYKYLHKYYNFAYILNGASYGTALSGLVQSNHNLQLGLTYVF